MKPVPNQIPSSDPGALRLAIVGEAPGADEHAQGMPFCGKSGWFLNQWLASAGVQRSQVFTGNVSQMRPAPDNNDFNLFEWNDARVQEGIAALREDLARFRPHCVVALGNAALHLLRHGNVGVPKSKAYGLFQWPTRIGTWRGSLFRAAASFDGFEASALRLASGRCPVDQNILGGSSSTGERSSTQSGRNPEDTGAVAAFDSPSTPPLVGKAPEKREARSREMARDQGGAVASAPTTNFADAQPGEPAREASFPLSTPRAPNHNASCNLHDGGAHTDGAGGSSNAGCPPVSFKALATYHPASTFREPTFVFPLVSDLKRAVTEARSATLELPPRNIRWGLPIDELETRCAAIRAARTPVGFDIEGGLGGLQCCSFAVTPHDAFVVDLMVVGENGPRIYKALTAVLEDPLVPKVCWNAAYERAILEAVASVTMRGYEDGMLAWWERFSELPKGLDFVASILTREPYWAEGIGWDSKTGRPKVTGPSFWTYNAIDSMVTLEIWESPLIRAVTEARTPAPFAA